MVGVQTVNIHAAKTHFSKLLERVAAGEEIIIAKAGKPVARLTAYVSKPAKRPIGLYKGQIVIHDNFDDPVPEWEDLAS